MTEDRNEKGMEIAIGNIAKSASLYSVGARIDIISGDTQSRIRVKIEKREKIREEAVFIITISPRISLRFIHGQSAETIGALITDSKNPIEKATEYFASSD